MNKRELENKEKRYAPFLYLLWVFVFLYSVEDMATSTNAYQEQGDRTVVYIYLIGILGILGIYYLLNFKVYYFSPMLPLFAIALWVFLDNLLLGNFFNENRWSALTHFGLVVWWFLSIIFAYKYSESNKNKEKQILLLSLLMLAYYIYKFIEVAFVSNSTHDETTVLNLIYRVIVFIPLLSMLKNGKLKMIITIIIFILTVVSMKRGALIVLPAMLLTGYLLDRKKKKNSIKTVLYFVVILLFAILAITLINSITDGFLAQRFTWESLLDGSSRSEKYAAAIDEISQRGTFELFFGIGSGKRSGVHNEVLEFLYTFGIIGLLIYLAMLVSMLRRVYQLYKMKSEYAPIYGMIFVFIFMVGLYSGVIFVHSTFYIMLTLGLVERRIFWGESNA